MSLDYSGAAGDYLNDTSPPADFAMVAGSSIQSFSGWIDKHSNVGTNVFTGGRMMFWGDVGANDGWGISVGQTYVTLFTNGGNLGTTLTAGWDITESVWNHVAGIFDQDAGYAAIYVDGSLIAEDSSYSDTSVASAANVEIWVGGTSITASPDGKFADFGWYNGRLSVDDITALSQGLPPTMVRPDILLAYHSFFGDDSNCLNAIVGGLNFTATDTSYHTNHPLVCWPEDPYMPSLDHAVGGGGGFQPAWAMNSTLTQGISGVASA